MNNTEINRIATARVLGDFLVELKFGDGFVATIDSKPLLWGPVFGLLADLAAFRQLRVEDDTIRWPNDAGFCPDVLRFWCESGGVRSQEETDEYSVRRRHSDYAMMSLITLPLVIVSRSSRPRC
jgi:hypothetical protein